MMKTLRLLLCFCALVLGPLGTSAPTANAQPASPTTASRPTADEKNVLVYPNPSTGIVHIDINGFNGRKTELRILNVIGSVIYRESLTELNGRFTKTLDLSKFASGLYYVKLESDNASEMRKLVIR
ncbi:MULTISPECIES: T9SS type A sorting domain-containing protein [Hymenobacter]|uniref:T9SS type A sorting domain-containing protein n=1 Tax=Hymenobacter TaxID=89966 RepID=UPI001058915B|nr:MULTISPECIES: T9SS type A sorting domain-containing protein [Hymenobacter]QIL76160.1 T9SS type A sorting domain-containing protein [Hymenobacter sp. HDW8]